MSFSQQELDQAVEKIVRTTVRREYGALGNRKVDQTFNDVQDAAAGVFISQINAPFYVVFLAAQRLQQSVQIEQELISRLSAAVQATGRKVRPVENLSALHNADVALRSLQAATSTRADSFKDIQDISAFQRFEQNTKRFLDQTKRSITSNGEVVDTPNEARGKIGLLSRELKSSHAEVIRRVELLSQAIDDFNEMGLRATLSSSIIQNASSTLSSAVSTLDSMTPEDRNKVIRNVALDILATRSTVRKFGSVKGPTTFLDITGTGSVFADSTHPATPAFIDSTIYDPYPILADSNELDVTLDGDASVTTTISVTGSFVARAEAPVVETYDIGQPNTQGLNNNELRLQLLDYPSRGTDTTIDTTLTVGAAVTVGQVAEDLNDAITAASPGAGPRIPLRAEPYPQPFRFSGAADIDVSGSSSDADFIATNPSTDFTALGVKEGDIVLVIDPSSDHDNSYFSVDAGGVSATTLVCSLVFSTSGTVPATDEVGMQIEVGGNVGLRLHITNDQDAARIAQPSPAYTDYRLQALIDRVSIHITQDGFTATADPTEDVQFNSATILGLYPNSTYVSRQTRATEVVNSYNNSFQSAVSGTVRTKAEAIFDPTLYEGSGRTNPANFLQVYASKFRETGDLTVTATTVTAQVTGAETAGVEVGDVLAITASSVVADVGLFGAITAVSDTAVTASISGATAATSVDFECGPDLTSLSTLDASVRITANNTLNDGTYRLRDVGPLPFQLELDTPLPFPGTSPGNLPRTFTLEVGRFFVRFFSEDTSIDTAITIDDGGGNAESAVDTFFSAGSASAVGSSRYFQLPQFPSALEEQDTLELTTTQYNQPSSVMVITSLEKTNKLVEVSPELPTDTADFTFSQEKEVPFARIRKTRFQNYSVFRASLLSWLTKDENKTTFFSNLNRLLNPLLVNNNPTIVQVNDAKGQLQLLFNTLGELTEHIDSYETSVVTLVDDLIGAFQQEGADRAVDLLLEAQFSTFFGLDQDGVSYSGTVQKNLREVTRGDLPVRKDNRVGQFSGDSELLASYQEPDYEFDTSDIEQFEEPDFNIGQDIEFPGRGY